MPKITHLNKKGEAHMVNVGDKKISKRYAMAEGFVRVNEEIIEKIKQDNLPKGDLFGSARIAGIMAAKKTSELIPLCHNLIISSIEIEIKLIKNGKEKKRNEIILIKKNLYLFSTCTKLKRSFWRIKMINAKTSIIKK